MCQKLSRMNFIFNFMALYGLYCVYGGFKMIPQQKGNF